MTSYNPNDQNNHSQEDDSSSSFCEGLTPQHLQKRLSLIRRHVAKPIPEPIAEFTDPKPAACLFQNGVLIGNKYHAADIPNLLQLGVTAVLNCASGGISRLPVDEMKDNHIEYSFTNVRSDHYDYPILFTKKGEISEHFRVAAALYQEVVVQKRGKILFFCVAGQNRSTTLAMAVLLLFGYELEQVVRYLGQVRPFVLENKGFQQQLVELEYILQNQSNGAKSRLLQDLAPVFPNNAPPAPQTTVIPFLGPVNLVEIELLIPGLCTMEVQIPAESTVATVKQILINHANVHLLSFMGSTTEEKRTVAKSWIVLASFGYDDMFDVPLEEDCLSLRLQIQRMRAMFGLQVTRKAPLKRSSSTVSSSSHRMNDDDEWIVHWNERCRFALVIFSVNRTVQNYNKENVVVPEPWTFVHEERPGAPATFLANTLNSTRLRAWDFVSGKAYCSRNPIVFCYAGRDESNVGRVDRRAFMKVSTSANEPQQYFEPGQILSNTNSSENDDNSGYILGMGENAIVHRVQLIPTSSDSVFDVVESTSYAEPKKRPKSDDDDKPEKEDLMAIEEEQEDMQKEENGESSTDTNEELQQQEIWDAAVKRPYTLDKMLASLNSSSSELGLAKRLRFANVLNSDGRIVEFYGLGIAFACNAYNPSEFKYELVLLSKYEQRFSTRTMKRFMEDYISTPCSITGNPQTSTDLTEVQRLQSNFTIMSVKVLLVSLLNAFRDLTLLGVNAFDFNHMNNVLISRDYMSVRLIDIDGGCIPSTYDNQQQPGPTSGPNKPGLDVDLSTVLPNVVLQLLLGKGRGATFVTNIRSEIWRAKEDKAKEIIERVIRENFYSHIMDHYGRSSEEYMRAEHHISNVARWFYEVLKKLPPWTSWTHDIYDAMRCIDHLPIG